MNSQRPKCVSASSPHKTGVPTCIIISYHPIFPDCSAGLHRACIDTLAVQRPFKLAGDLHVWLCFDLSDTPNLPIYVTLYRPATPSSTPYDSLTMAVHELVALYERSSSQRDSGGDSSQSSSITFRNSAAGSSALPPAHLPRDSLKGQLMIVVPTLSFYNVSHQSPMRGTMHSTPWM